MRRAARWVPCKRISPPFGNAGACRSVLFFLFLCTLVYSAPIPAAHGLQSRPANTSISSSQNNSASASPDQPLAAARSQLQAGHVDEAENAIRHYLKDHARSAAAHFLLGYTLFRKVQLDVSAELNSASTTAQEEKSRQEYAKLSLAEFTEAARYEVPSAFDLKVVAMDYVLLKDYSDADKWLTRSLQKDAGDSESWYYLGRTKYNENRFAEAIGAFQQYLKLDPKSVKGKDNLGLSYQGLGRTADAANAYRDAIAMQEHNLGQDPGPYINLAALLLDQNRPHEAIPYLQRAVAISPQDTRAHEQLGKSYERLAQLPKAQSEYEKAVELTPQNSRLHYMLGHVYQKQGMTEKAKLEFDRSEALKKENPDR